MPLPIKKGLPNANQARAHVLVMRITNCACPSISPPLLFQALVRWQARTNLFCITGYSWLDRGRHQIQEQTTDRWVSDLPRAEPDNLSPNKGSRN